MEYVLTPEQMRAADQATISNGTPEAELMERAGHASHMTALRILGGAYGKRVVVVAGKGNNGGDGVICGRNLGARGVAVTTLRTDDWSREAFDRATRDADLVIDAVLGTGTSGEPRGPVADAIASIANCGRRVFAIDIPSGVNGADGAVPGVAVRADVTLAIQALKIGHVTPPGAFRCGRIDVADIGIATHDVHTFVQSARDIRGVLPEREEDTHKYEVGALAVLAGSTGMTGAAILTARAAVRAGAGLVVCGVPSSTIDVFETAVIEAIKVPLPEVEGQLDAKAVDEFADRLERCRALAIGPGIGRGPRSVALIRRALNVSLPLVVDGDGLWALAEVLRETPEAVKWRDREIVLTPHSGEFAFLAGRPPKADRVSDARELAERLGAVVHLKGRRAVTAARNGVAWVNITGNPGAATGGTGDVLTGTIGSLIAQGMRGESATWAGAYVHGVAADIAASRLGQTSLAAGDLVDALPRAFVQIARSRHEVGALRTVVRA